MDGGSIRIGRVSKVDYKHGYISVIYAEHDDTVTDMMPYLTFNQEYHMPAVGDYVAVVHMSNGIEAGLVMGTYWNDKDKPAATGKDLYRKEFSHKAGKAYMQHDANTGELIIRADKIRLRGNVGSVTLAEIISHLQTAH